MGFGLLLCGYFTITLASVGMGDYRFLAYLLGGWLCVSATAKLKAYNPRFLLPLGVSVAYMALGNHVLDTVIDVLKLVINLALHGTMLWSIIELTHSLGMDKLRTRAIRNLISMVIYFIGEIVVLTVPAAATLDNQAIPRLLLLYLLVCYLLNSWLLFSCYQNICPAGEEYGKPSKPSRFAFINKLNDKFDEKAARAMREQMAYQAEKQAKRQSKKKKKKK